MHTHTHTLGRVTACLYTNYTVTHTDTLTCTHSLYTLPSPLQLRHAGEEATNGLPHHGVLAHEDDASPAHGPADVLHLTGAHIVRSNHEHTVVGLKGLLHNERERRRVSKQHTTHKNTSLMRGYTDGGHAKSWPKSHNVIRINALSIGGCIWCDGVCATVYQGLYLQTKEIVRFPSLSVSLDHLCESGTAAAI